jgi:hypothetical protein
MLSVQLNGLVGAWYAVSFMEERRASNLKEADIASSKGEIHSQLSGRQRRRLITLCELERRSGAGLLRIEHPGARHFPREWSVWTSHNMDRRTHTNGNFDDLTTHRGSHSMFRLRNHNRWLIRYGLPRHLSFGVGWDGQG